MTKIIGYKAALKALHLSGDKRSLKEIRETRDTVLLPSGCKLSFGRGRWWLLGYKNDGSDLKAAAAQLGL